MRFPVLEALAPLIALAPFATAQMGLDTTGDGGAVPGSTRVAMTGTPNAPYLLLFSEREQSWEPLPGIKLEIDLSYLAFSLTNPLFFGTLDGAGKALTTIPVPNLAGLYGARMSMQCLQANPLGEVSNLLRVTLQQPATFARTWTDATAPTVTGQGFLQADGKVLLLGGTGPVVQEYDPLLEQFSTVASVPSANVLATQTQLPDGTILVCGGLGASGQPVDTAFLFDPATGKSATLPNMATARAGHAAAALGDGRVLVVGGAKSFDFANLLAFLAGIQNTSEFFDPKTRTFAPGPALLEQKMFHSATALDNGEVLVAGGLSVLPVVNLPIVSPTAQSYQPALKTFGFPSLMAKGRMLHGATALRNGRALLAGGLNIDFTKFLQTLNILDLVVASVDDAVTYLPGLFGGFSAPMLLSNGRLLPAVAPIGKSGALIAGGFELAVSTSGLGFKALAESDLFDGATVTATGSMRTARIGAVAVSLPDGTVLVTGGGSLQSEIFQPR